MAKSMVIDAAPISERAMPRRQQQERREIAYYVRAKTGPGSRDWSPVGVAFERRGGEPGFTIKLNTLPIDRDWNGALVLVPPFADSEEIHDDPI